MRKIGWIKNKPCFYKVELKANIPEKYLNSSAKKLKNKKKLNILKDILNNQKNTISMIILYLQ